MNKTTRAFVGIWIVLFGIFGFLTYNTVSHLRQWERFGNVYSSSLEGGTYVATSNSDKLNIKEDADLDKLGEIFPLIADAGITQRFSYEYLATDVDGKNLPTLAFISSCDALDYFKSMQLGDDCGFNGRFNEEIHEHGPYVYLGANFGSDFNVGDTFNPEKYGLRPSCTGQVQGYLKPHQQFCTLTNINESTDNLIIFFVTPKQALDIFEVSDYSMMLCNSIFTLKNKGQVEKLEDILDGCGYANFEILPFQQAADKSGYGDINLLKSKLIAFCIADAAMIGIGIYGIIRYRSSKKI